MAAIARFPAWPLHRRTVHVSKAWTASAPGGARGASTRKRQLHSMLTVHVVCSNSSQLPRTGLHHQVRSQEAALWAPRDEVLHAQDLLSCSCMRGASWAGRWPPGGLSLPSAPVLRTRRFHETPTASIKQPPLPKCPLQLAAPLPPPQRLPTSAAVSQLLACGFWLSASSLPPTQRSQRRRAPAGGHSCVGSPRQRTRWLQRGSCSKR